MLDRNCISRNKINKNEIKCITTAPYQILIKFVEVTGGAAPSLNGLGQRRDVPEKSLKRVFD